MAATLGTVTFDLIARARGMDVAEAVVGTLEIPLAVDGEGHMDAEAFERDLIAALKAGGHE